MYKSFSAADYKKFLGLSEDYHVDGFIVYGTYKKFPYDQLKNSLAQLYKDVACTFLPHEFLNQILEFRIDDKIYWFTVAYGGALLSEYLHLACLFGSKMTILLGTCGGLKRGLKTEDIIVPICSFAEESSAKAYQPQSNNKYHANAKLSAELSALLMPNYNVVSGETITYQAMLAETWDDIQNWSNQGYVGVEMEAATIFAVSNHFNVPAAAVLRVADNLIEEHTVLDINFEKNRDARRKLSQSMFEVVLKVLCGFEIKSSEETNMNYKRT